jgi:hypothetical protein
MLATASARIPISLGTEATTTTTATKTDVSGTIDSYDHWQRHLHTYYDDPYREQCAEDEILVLVDLQTDWYGNETSWEIVRNADGVAVVVSGMGLGNRQQYTTTKCLPRDCYTFTIRDSQEDGMCCNYGLGRYNVTIGTGFTMERVLLAGGTFGALESVSFGSECKPRPASYPKTQCVNVTVSLTTEDSPWETSLFLFDLGAMFTGTNYWSSPYLDLPEHAYTLTECIDPTKCYEVGVTDYGVNGLSRKSFSVSYNDQDVQVSGDDNNRSSSVLIGDGCASRPPCVDLNLSLTTDDSPYDTSVSLYDVVAGMTYWYDTTIDQPIQQYSWSKCIDPLRCYEVQVYSYSETDGLLTDVNAMLTYDGNVAPANFTITPFYYVGDGCSIIGYQNYYNN